MLILNFSNVNVWGKIWIYFFFFAGGIVVKKSRMWDLGADLNTVLAEVEYDHHNYMLMNRQSLEEVLFCHEYSLLP